MTGKDNPMLFLDEIHNISGWEKFARRMADNKKTIWITGSNAKMLSKEIMTTLSKEYKNEDVLSSLIESLKRKMDYNNVIGNKFDIDAYAYRHNVTFKYKDRNVTFKLPLIFEWGNPQE